MTRIAHRIAIVSHRDRDSREAVPPDQGRFAAVFGAFAELGARAETVSYHDDDCSAVRGRLQAFDAVLVWINPEEGGRDRTVLDAMLREIATTGVFVSAHPDTILKMGTKEVLYRTRTMGWGADTHVYRSPEHLRRELPARLAQGQVRVLKQYRGHSGDGVWKVELAGHPDGTATDETLVRVRHAKRGSVEETIALREFLARCAPYFMGEGRIVDQAYQTRLPEGMVRCYLVHDQVGGFGLQAVNALHPAPPGEPASAAPLPSKRLYYPPTLSQYQDLKQKLECEWVAEMQALLGIATEELPVLWDCDFLLGPRDASGKDTYVLCEINVSSVSPFPDSAAPVLARATLDRLTARRSRGPS